MGLLGEGAEIGVYEGGFSRWILLNWKGKKLYSIDPWKHQGRKLDKSDLSQEEHDIAFGVAKMNLREFGQRSEIIRKTSRTAHLDIPISSLDFAYIDACHDFRSVLGDLEIWWKMIKKGGVLAGHDYKNSFVRKNLVEVKQAVDNFFWAVDRKVLTTTEDNLPSWYVVK